MALEQSPPGRLDDTLFLGELALNGDLRRVRGVLPIVSQAVQEGLSRIVVPEDNVAEACLVKAAEVYSASSLREAVEFLSAGEVHPKKVTPSRPRASVALDLSDVKGQRHAKRALEVAAAGGHNLLLSGPPGAGKSLLAMRLPSILPPLLPAEALEVTKIHSVAGLLDDGALVEAPPFRSPHHTLSTASMVGGGSGLMPGEASLAHRGVLFLDELPEFSRSALESLRQPLEDGRVRIRRVERVASLPARFALVAAMKSLSLRLSGRGGAAMPVHAGDGASIPGSHFGAAS